jgi:chloramphenicol-sensitive protein RarD
METRETIDLAGERQRSTAGVLFGTSAFLIWGLSPLFWKLLQSIPALELICHRIVWSFVFLIPLVLFSGKQRNELKQILAHPKTLVILLITSLLVGSNWLVYVWAINNDRVLEASLGFYINPLISVFLGMLFLKERMRFLQGLSVALACGGVLFLTLEHGEFPTVALFLAFTFGVYGLIRKVAPVSAITGLIVEALILTLPALIYLGHLSTSGAGVFGQKGISTDLLLMTTALVTAPPLLFFTLGAQRLALSTMGFLQYIAPTCMFFLGVYLYHEPFTRVQVVIFLLIWTALAIYSTDSFLFYRKFYRYGR